MYIKHNKKTVNKKYKRNFKKRTSKNKKIMGGNLKNLIADKIGQGTHGTIYVSKNKPEHVIKVFKNDEKKQKCNEIKENEFIVQKKIFNNLLNTDCKIVIPAVYDFILEEPNCYYDMDRIYPTNTGNIIIVDMYLNDIEKIFSHSTIGRLNSYSLLDYTGCNIGGSLELSFEIGKIFSYIHYVLHYDGYDCELIMGNNYKNEKTFFLIDFDKVSKFNFDFGYTIYRKLDETTRKDERVIKEEKNIASLLFTAMTSMSLIPIKSYLLEQFINGYKFYVDFDNKIQKMVFELVKGRIDEYATIYLDTEIDYEKGRYVYSI
jgi:hypothetical protein